MMALRSRLGAAEIASADFANQPEAAVRHPPPDFPAHSLSEPVEAP